MQEWIETAEELERSIPNRSDIDPSNSQIRLTVEKSKEV